MHGGAANEADGGQKAAQIADVEGGVAPVEASTSASMMRSAAKASISRARSPSACFSTNKISAILSSVIVTSVVGSRCRNPNLLRRSAMTASVHPRPRAALRHGLCV
jgi:hypothetical protein